MQGSQEEQQKIWAKIIAKAWSDEEFKQQLFDNPEAVLEEHGIELAEGAKLHLHENRENEVHLTFPLKPTGELSEDQLSSFAAGMCNTSFSVSH